MPGQHSSIPRNPQPWIVPVLLALLLPTLAVAEDQPAAETPLITDLRHPQATESPIFNNKPRTWAEYESDLARVQKAFGDQDPFVILISDKTPFGAVLQATTLARKFYPKVFVECHCPGKDPMLLDLSVNVTAEKDRPAWMAGGSAPIGLPLKARKDIAPSATATALP